MKQRTIALLLVLANSLPVVGLAVFGWGLLELLVVYCLEAVFALVFGAIRVCSAQLVAAPVSNPRHKPTLSSRHGKLQLGPLSVYLRSLSRVGALLLWAVFLLFPVLVLVHPSSAFHYPVTAPTRDSVVLVAGALAFVHVLITKNHFDQKRDQELPPTASARSAAWLPLAVVGLVGVLFLREQNTAQPLLVTWPEPASYAIVGAKLLIATAAWQYRGRLIKQIDDDTDLYDLPPNLLETLQVTTLPSVERPQTAPKTTASPGVRRLVGNAPVHGLAVSNTGAELVFVGFAVIAVVLLQSVRLLALNLGILAVIGVVTATVYVIPRHATVQYELYDDRIVCYDWWQAEPVWALDYDAITDVSQEQGIAGRVGGYGTVVLETDEEPSARLLHLPAYEAVAEEVSTLLCRDGTQSTGAAERRLGSHGERNDYMQ